MDLRIVLVISLAVFAVAENATDCQSPKHNHLPKPNDYYCYGLGEYSIGTIVNNTKCPQLNLTSKDTGLPTKVVSRTCMVNGVVKTGMDCFAVTTAVWNTKDITGIGLEGYWTDYKTEKENELYGWVDGVIPAATIEPSIVKIGMEVLCRDPEITGRGTFPKGTEPCIKTPETEAKGCWMEGQIVDPSIDHQWVCKLTDLTRQIIPFVSHENIIPLCFAKSRDYQAGRNLNIAQSDDIQKRVKSTALRANSGGSHACDCRDPACNTCCPWCSIEIPQAGYLCPTEVTLGMGILHYNLTTFLYKRGNVTGMYYTDAKMEKLHLQVDFKEVQAQWGPQPNNADFIIPFTHATDIDPLASFGLLVLCPTVGCKDPKKLDCPVYESGTIYNTPMQTHKAYHLYGCDNKDFDKSKMKTCMPDQMLTLCWPTSL